VARERAEDSHPEVCAAALEALARLASSSSIGVDALTNDLDHADARVRGAAVTALAAQAAAHEESLEAIGSALADRNREVRKRAVEALSALGEDGASVCVPYLRFDLEGTPEAASEVLSKQPSSRKLLIEELRRRVRLAWGDLLSLQVLPKRGSLSTRFLRVAHADSVRRNQSVAFAILRGIEDPAVVGSVERALRLGSPRSQAEALEVLSNLGDREAANLLVLMLEDSSVEDKMRAADSSIRPYSGLDEAVDADRRALDIWIRMGSEYYRKNGEGDISQRETMERLLLLREVPLFTRLSLQQLDAISRIMTESYYLHGEIVFREGDPGGELYLLIEGRARIVTDLATPDEVTLNALLAPASFGEMAILDDQPRSASVVITEDARVLSLGGDSFKDLMLQQPEIAFEICRELTSRVRILEATAVGSLARGAGGDPSNARS
jgi:HEAT repeat protein